MPGQRKRKAQRRRESEARRAARQDGRWERRFATQDQAEFRAYVHELLRGGDLRPEDVRLDMLCGRLTHPTTHVVSVWVSSIPYE
ncbi:hypothetical protein [Streptomyces lavendulae]|uniref:hypothetical protein n=1 Tax=Streptomyces lavendulae TaxID=1914 RepID=UPI0024A4DE3B|nr:hypothetical protein [Streptomyces lavendulae]GLW00157.1 hypothetical protein Slala05_37880 [Streptomyces lavendulae subsp. lavendulae]